MLLDILEKRRLSEIEIANVCRAILKALVHLHSLGLVHRYSSYIYSAFVQASALRPPVQSGACTQVQFKISVCAWLYSVSFLRYGSISMTQLFPQSFTSPSFTYSRRLKLRHNCRKHVSESTCFLNLLPCSKASNYYFRKVSLPLHLSLQRDIKSDQILYDDGDTIKLHGFGFSAHLEEAGKRNSLVKTIHFIKI